MELSKFLAVNASTLARKAAATGLHGLEWARYQEQLEEQQLWMQEHKNIAYLNISRVLQHYLWPVNTIIKVKDLNFGYRYSLLQREVNCLICSTQAGIGQAEQIRQITNENLNHRLKTQPYSAQTAVVQPEPLKAAKLIEELGLKGFRLVELKYQNSFEFIINVDKASSCDVKELIEYIQKEF